MEYDLLKSHVRRYIDIQDTDLEILCSFFKLSDLAKGEYLLRQGKICRIEGFVTEGLFQVYTTDEALNDHTLYFAAKDWWLMDIDSFMHQKPSELSIQAVEKSTVLLIGKSDKEYLYRQLPAVEKLFRLMSQKALVAWQRRLIQNHCLKASERYQILLESYPEIVMKISDRQIANYLGITHEFLSKIKKKIVNT